MLELIQYWLKWWKQILVFCAIAILSAVIISSPTIMKPYYKSRMVFYPANPASHDKETLFSERNAVIDNFGSKDDVNRFLSIANSGAFIHFMVDSFQLKKHYKIRKEGYYYVDRQFRGNYKAIRNDLGAIEMEIMDTDPVLAAQMVKAAVEFTNNQYKDILKQNKATAYEVLKQDAQKKQRELAILADSLNILKKNVKYFYDKEGNLVGDEHLRLLDKRFQALNKYVQELNVISDQYQVSSSEKYPSIYVIENANIAEKKTKPVRWLIVLGTAVMSFVTATVVIVLIELLKHAKLSNREVDI